MEEKRPAMLYFSAKSIDPNSLDGEQFKALKEFKASCNSRGLYESIKLYRNLEIN